MIAIPRSSFIIAGLNPAARAGLQPPRSSIAAAISAACSTFGRRGARRAGGSGPGMTGLAWGVLAALLLAAPAQAQVTMDLKALDQPGQAAPADDAKPKPRPKPKPAPRLVPAPGTAHITPPAPLPTAVPPVVRLAPDVTSPAPPPPAQPPPIEAGSETKTAPLQNGLRVLFTAGKSDLSPESDADIAALAAAAPKSDTLTYDVRAYAPGTPEDPSTSRRLSLARALAVRDSLMARGVPSAHIYVRALGATEAPKAAGAPPGRAPADGAPADGAPPDRADVTIAGANGPQQTAGAK